jgi:septal ring factor EnvC (AmiA/AmiB activator)
MRSFLYLARLPRRAIAVAQQAIEDDSDFRSRVAAQAMESDVGRAGYLWLHRPIGWAPEFEALSREAEHSDDHVEEHGQFAQIVDIPTGADDGDVVLTTLNSLGGAENGFERPQPSLHANLLGTDDDVSFSDGESGHHVDGVAADTDDSDSTSAASMGGDVSELDLEADAIESELSSLRGLVDRLAGERDNVMASSINLDPLDSSLVSRLEDELAVVTADLDAAHHELNMAQQELASARAEREEARRLQSDALRRQVELERELTASREAKSQVDTQISEFQVSVISLDDKLKRLTTDRDELERERNVAQSQLETMTAERNHIREDRMVIKAERDDLAARLREVDEKTGGVDVGELAAANRSLTQELEATSRELARMIAQVESLDQQLGETTTEADSLKVERTDLSSRLADTQLAFETTSTKYEALKIDSERLAAEVGTLRAERDGLQSQLIELQSSLTDVLDEQAEIRHRNDADRKALNELRVERDVLVARMSEIEQADRSYENRINALIKERDDLMAARDDLVSERGQLRGEAAAAASAREQLMEKIDTLEGKLGPLEIELQAERRQREELANRLLELDDIAATNQAATEQLTAERDSMLERVEALTVETEAAKELRRERDQLQTRADRAEQRAEAAERQLQEETERQAMSVSELTEQVTELESAKSGADSQLTETRGELATLRADIEELNRDNAKLRFNLQVAEASFTEATEAAEAARQEAEAARQEVAEAMERAESAEVASRAGGLGVEALAGSPPADVVDDTGTTVDDAEPAEVTGPETDEAEQLEVSALEVSAFADAGQPVTTESDEPVPVDDMVEAELDEEVDDTAGVGDGFGFLTPDEALVGGGMDDLDSMEFRPPSLLSDHDLGFDADLDALSPIESLSDEPAAAIDQESTAVSDVVDMEQRRIRDETAPFTSDWQPESTPGETRERDELDEIGDLISQAAAEFEKDPSLSDPTVSGAPDTTVAAVGLTPPSVFDTEEDRQVTPTYGRRQIDIPPDIADDEIAVAQYVVSSPDIVLLVDGDSVAQMGWPSLPVAQQRDALVTYLADLSASSGAAPDVVFDGRMGDDDSLPRSQAVRIRLSTPPTEPAAALDELVSAYPEQWPIALVTDDPVLAASAQERGATVLNNGQLLDLFIAQ